MRQEIYNLQLLMVKKSVFFLAVAVLHLVAVGVILYAFLPIAQWYFENPTLPPSNLNSEAKPLWGVDFQYTVTLTNLLRGNIVLPQMGWGYQWFTGWPLLSNYPLLHYYLILPLTQFFDLISAVKIWMLVTLGLFFLGLYATFYLLSRNILLSTVLAIAGIYSVGVYGTLMWGGSLPNHATQSFLPWVVFFIILYLKKQSARYLLIASLLGGLAIWGHPQVVIAYIYPFAGILFLTSFWGIKLLSRIKALIIFVVISIFIGLPLLYTSAGGALKVLVVTKSTEVASSTARTPSGVNEEIVAFHRTQPLRIYIDTNTTIFVLLGIAFFLFTFALIFFKGRRLRLLEGLPFLVLAGFSVFYIWIFSYGISVYHGGWYRLFWAAPFWLGLLTASLWGAAYDSIKEQFASRKKILLSISGVLVIVLFVASIPSLLFFAKDIRNRIVPRSNTSSAFPDVLNLRVDPEERERLKKELIPSWLEGDQTNFRIYSADQTVNIWWNSLYRLPLARGYLDPPGTHGYSFWLDAALSQDNATGEDQLAASFNYPKDIAFNNTLFLIDWYAVKYFEAGHAGPTAYAPLPRSLTREEFVKREQELDFNKEKYNKGNQTLKFYELKDEFVTPILYSTNAPTLGIVASDGGYETIVRAIADMGLNSQNLIPIKLGQFLDKVTTRDLSSTDGLLLYDYKYKNKDWAFKIIEEYVKKGKRVFIDTGVEVEESEESQLPSIFPINSSVRKPLRETWDFELLDSQLGSGVDFSQFDPPLFDDLPWKLSYPSDPYDLRPNSGVILKNHGVPLMISKKIGEGEIIWSGLNLPYHVIRFHNKEEIKFIKNVLNKIISPKGSQNESYQTKFISPQHREITTTKASGILFKEQAYPGWEAIVKSNSKNQKVKIYKAGPADPGFMYVRLPQNFDNAIVTFTYKGSIFSWLLSLFSFTFILFIVDEVFLKGVFLGRLRRLLLRRVHNWWGREDE